MPKLRRILLRCPRAISRWCRKRVTMLRCLMYVAVIVTFIYKIRNQLETSTPSTAFPKTIIVGVGGLRCDLLQRAADLNIPLPNFDYLMETGARLDRMMTCFPADTATSLACLSTGLFPDKHGIIGDHFYIPEKNERYSFGQPNSTSPWLPNVTPLWKLNEKFSEPKCNARNHECRRSAVVMWPNSNDPTSLTPKEMSNLTSKSAMWSKQTIIPYFSDGDYSKSNNWKKHIDILISWMFHKQHPANLGMIYFDDLEHVSIRGYPELNDLVHALQSIDEKIGYLMKLLCMVETSHPALSRMASWSRQQKVKFPLTNINLVVVGDHGLAVVKEKVDLLSLLSPELVNDSLFDGVNTIRIRPKLHVADPLKWEKDMKAQLKNASQRNQLEYYSGVELPGRFHYGDGRGAKFVVLANPGVYLTASSTREPVDILGAHGYNPEEMSMHTTLIARGPAFKTNFQLVKLYLTNIVHVFSLLCLVLRVWPEQSDGRPFEIVQLLSDYA